MTFFRHISVFVLGVALVASASSLTFTDVDVDGNEGEPEYKYMASWGFNTWSKTFNLLDAGFDPATMEILSATVSFAFADDRDDRSDNKSWKKEYVTLSVSGETLWNWQEVDGSHASAPGSYDWYTEFVGESILNDLQDGIAAYSVTAQSGDFYLKEASITAEVGNIKVPDAGATLGMLSLGIATVFVLRRQMLKGKDA